MSDLIYHITFMSPRPLSTRPCPAASQFWTLHLKVAGGRFSETSEIIPHRSTILSASALGLSVAFRPLLGSINTSTTLFIWKHGHINQQGQTDKTGFTYIKVLKTGIASIIDRSIVTVLWIKRLLFGDRSSRAASGAMSFEFG